MCVCVRECTFCKLALASVQMGQTDSVPVRESSLRKQLRSHDHRVAVDFGSSGRAVVVVIVAAVVAINSYALFASSRRVASFQVRAALRILIRRLCVA